MWEDEAQPLLLGGDPAGPDTVLPQQLGAARVQLGLENVARDGEAEAAAARILGEQHALPRHVPAVEGRRRRRGVGGAAARQPVAERRRGGEERRGGGAAGCGEEARRRGEAWRALEGGAARSGAYWLASSPMTKHARASAEESSSFALPLAVAAARAAAAAAAGDCIEPGVGLAAAVGGGAAATVAAGRAGATGATGRGAPA